VLEMSQAKAGKGNPRGSPPKSKQQTNIPSFFLQSASPAVRLPQDKLSEIEWPSNVEELLEVDPRSDRTTPAGGEKAALSTSEVNLRQTFWKALGDKAFADDQFVAPTASEGVKAATLDERKKVLASARALHGKTEERTANFEKLLVRGFPVTWKDSQKKKDKNATEKSIRNKECKLRAVLRTGSAQYLEYNISEMYPWLPLFNLP
jgi:hypothetical protein